MTNYLDLSAFERKKGEVFSFIHQIEEVANGLHATEVSHQLGQLTELLERDHFNLTVVGEFSQGKSTFINALLGKKILPSKVKPTTAMINRIFYADEPTFTLKFRDEMKEKQILDEKAFMKLTAPREPDEEDSEDVERYEEELAFFQSVGTAEIGYPNELCKAGVEIFDTPGTNDVDEAREEITYLFVPKSDAVIFLLSGTTPFGASEKEFLMDRILSEHIEKVFFVVNFKDRITTIEEQEKVMKYTEEKLEELLPNPKIYLVSSLDTLTIRRHQSGEKFRVRRQRYKEIEETGFDVLEKDLAYFLQYEKGHTKLRRPLMHLEKITYKLLTEAIPLRMSASKMELKEVVQKIEELKPKLEKFKLHTSEIIHSLIDRLVVERENLLQNMNSQMILLRNAMIDSLDDYEGDFEQGDLEAYLKFVSRNPQRKMNAYMKNRIDEAIKTHMAAAHLKLNEEEKDLNEAVRDAFDVRLNVKDSLAIIESKKRNPEEDDLFVAGAVGATIGAVSVAVITAPLLAIGGVIAFFGALFSDVGTNAMDWFKEHRRTQKIEETKKMIRKNFQTAQVEAENSFSHEWEEIVRKVKRSFTKEINQKVKMLRDELSQIRLESELEKRSIEEKQKYYEKLNQDVQQIQEKTSKLLDEMTL